MNASLLLQVELDSFRLAVTSASPIPRLVMTSSVLIIQMWDILQFVLWLFGHWL
jgi:hypothetical protein